jgi:hypothetical protein
MPSWRKIPALLLILIVGAASLYAAAGPTSPKQYFGFAVGDDYQMINYTQLVAYWKKLDQESDRMTVVDIGKSEEGRTMIMAIISSPANLKKLARYKDISRRLALAKGLTDASARALAVEGKAVVWIDGGLHATEVVGGQAITELVWQMTSGKDAETLRLLDDVILLVCPVNPDGLQLVADWYMREKDPLKRSMSGVPRLYQKYIGHDNNRDFYMVTQSETEAVSRELFIDWHPQFIYNQHQTGPAGTVLFCPPFRDPFYYDFDPLIPLGTDLLGLAMHERFAAEGKPGAIMRGGASYSTWWNGGLRSTGYFHNAIGILTEIIGGPTPVDIPFVPARMLPTGDYPYPVMPQKWHFRQSIDYSITASRAILNFAAERREDVLWNRYVMGRNAIAKGSSDNWTFQPHDVASLQSRIDQERSAAAPANPAGAGAGGQRGGAVAMKYYEALRDPAKRDPRGFIVPSDQPDFATATKFVNTLIKSGVTVLRATKAFAVAGKSYPAGSYVVKTAQAFRAHLMSMFEPQDHPNDFAYPGGPPRPPYDSAGWTVAYQMGIRFERILDPFDGPFQEIAGFAKPPATTFGAEKAKAAGFLISHQVNDAVIAVNRLLKAGEEVYWLKAPLEANGKTYPTGTIYVPARPSALPVLDKAAKDFGLAIDSLDLRPAGEALKLKPVRIGLWDTYGGSMDSGWMRWTLEKFEFSFEVVYAPALDAGNLSAKFDVLIFVSGGIPAYTAPGREGAARGGFAAPTPGNIPPEFQAMIGRVTADKTIPQIRKFLEDGGTVLTISGSTALAYHLGLPVANHLLEKAADGRETAPAREKYYVPGSILQVRVDNTNPLAYGMPERVDVFFDNSPVFDLMPEAALKDVRAVAWFESKNPLRSGWVWGDAYLWRGIQVIDAPVAKGRLFLFGPEIIFRGQPHGTFKLLFNGIYGGSALETKL